LLTSVAEFNAHKEFSMRINIRLTSPCLLAAVAVLWSVAARSDAQEPLRWKFAQGQKLDYNMVTDMKMTGDGGMNTSVRQEMDMTWDVQEVKADGDAVIRQKFDRIRTKMSSPFGAFEYDSQSNEAPAGAGATVKALTEGAFVVTMSARGEVKDVQVPEEMVTALKNSPGGTSELASSEGLKKMITQAALILPEGPPKQGEEWKTKVPIPNPMPVNQTVETTYTYEGTKDVEGTTFALIRPEMKIEFGPPEAKADGAAAEKPQLDINVSEQSSKGEVLFDAAAGRLHSSEVKQDYTLDVNANGQAMKQKVEQTVTVKVKPAGQGEAESEAVSAQSQQ
jgi:hypothetical protein